MRPPYPPVYLFTLASVCLGCGDNIRFWDAAGDDGIDGGGAAGPRIWINEVVTYPTNDWSHSDGFGSAFDGTPGTGMISNADEFVELHNADTESHDLSGWTLEVRDLVTATTVIGKDGTLRFSGESSLGDFRPGDFMLLGNPQGSMDTDAYIVLRDAAGEVVDEVEIGGLSSGRDMEGDGIGDGAPAPGENGFAFGGFDESLARPADSGDTDDDQADFVKMVATPLAANLPRDIPVEFTPPWPVAFARGPDFAVTDLIWIEFNETIDPVSTVGNVTATVDGEPIPIEVRTFQYEDRRMYLNPIGRLPFSSDIDIAVRGGVGGVTDLAGNPLTADVMFTVGTEAAPADPAPVLINEICASPVQDWGDSSGGDGIPFSDTPGNGPVTSGDEWVEFLVAAPGVVDLSTHSLRIYRGHNLTGGPVAITPMTSNLATIRVVGASSSIDAVASGDRVILGDPRGAILTDAYLELRDGDARLIDAVEIGGNTPETDRGGDGLDNGAPAPGADGSSTDESDETVARRPDGVDTGNDTADFVSASATLGAAN